MNKAVGKIHLLDQRLRTSLTRGGLQYHSIMRQTGELDIYINRQKIASIRLMFYSMCRIFDLYGDSELKAGGHEVDYAFCDRVLDALWTEVERRSEASRRPLWLLREDEL